MVSGAWFFSTLAQVSAALFGFIITITVALRQLKIRERQERTKELRNSLLNFRDTYQNLMFEVVEVIELPFEDSFEPSKYDISVDDLSIEEIKDLPDDNLERPICSKISMICYKCGMILDGVSPSAQTNRNNLISKQKITQLQLAAEYISNVTSKPDGMLINEIERKSAYDDISLSEEIFTGNTETDYEDLARWIKSQIDIENRQSSINGSNIISLSNIFKKFKNDINEISTKSENTLLTEKQSHDNLPEFTIPFMSSGIILPLFALINSPINVLVLSGVYLIAYQILLVLLTTIFAYLMIDSISNS